MRDNTEEKSLIVANENGILYKIKNFFRNLFYKNKAIENHTIIEHNIKESSEKENNKNSFMESVKDIENEETRLLKLQKQYRNGEIKEEELTEEQINSLSVLYDKQIANLRKSNQIRKQKLMEYRKRLQTDS